MVSSPLLLGFEVQQPSGTARSNIQVLCSNETTNQSQALNTGTDGKLIFNLGDTKEFSKGWSEEDVINVSSLYQAYEQTFNFTIPAAGTTIAINDTSGVNVGSFTGGIGMTVGTLILVTKVATPSLRYFTSQEFLDYFDTVDSNTDAENGIKIQQLILIGQGVEAGIDSSTNSKFDSNDGSYYSSSVMEGGESPEYHDAKYNNQKAYFVDFTPIQTLTTFEANDNQEGTTASWDSLTETDNEIVVDKATGRISIVDSSQYPEVGARQVRITYVFGRATTPQDIKELAIVETGVRMLGAAFIEKRIKNLSDVEIGDLSSFMTFRNKVIRKYRNAFIRPT